MEIAKSLNGYVKQPECLTFFIWINIMLVVLRHTTPNHFEAVKIELIRKGDIFRYLDDPDVTWVATKDAVGNIVEKKEYDH